MCLICERIDSIRRGTNPYFVKELETGYVVLSDHQHFRGYTLFLCKRHETELFHLDPEFQQTFLREMVQTAQAVSRAFHAEKMNYECLGQGDAHLHWHLYPRVSGDIGDYGNHGVGPVWWYPREKMYDDQCRPTSAELAALKELLLAELSFQHPYVFPPAHELPHFQGKNQRFCPCENPE